MSSLLLLFISSPSPSPSPSPCPPSLPHIHHQHLPAKTVLTETRGIFSPLVQINPQASNGTAVFCLLSSCFSLPLPYGPHPPKWPPLAPAAASAGELCACADRGQQQRALQACLYLGPGSVHYVGVCGDRRGGEWEGVSVKYLFGRMLR